MLLALIHDISTANASAMPDAIFRPKAAHEPSLTSFVTMFVPACLAMTWLPTSATLFVP